MSDIQQNLDAGQTRGQTQAKAQQGTESVHDAARNTTARGTQSGQHCGQAQQMRDENAGFIHQTGEQMKNTPQSAVDSAKNTLGMGNKK
uniref:Uncharacterized protein n=1 Tax=Rhizophora mucronata TaxID=61149 RepID=A0A2P2IXM3_RHIMU